MHKVTLENVTAPLISQRYYTTKPGDTLNLIAMHFYRNPREATRIFMANRVGKYLPDMSLGQLKEMNPLPSGVRLFIP